MFEDEDQTRTLLVCGPIPGEELSYADLTELRHQLIQLSDLFRCRCIFEDDRKGTIVYENASNAVIFRPNQEPDFRTPSNVNHHDGSGRGHLDSGADTNMVNAGLHTPGTYSHCGNLLQQKNSRVRLMKNTKALDRMSVIRDRFIRRR